MRTTALLMLGLLLGASAQAQVLRCTDARTGAVSYTDGSCQSGSQTREIEARKSPEALRAEREQAAQALAREQQQRDADAAAQERALERAQAERDAALARQRLLAPPVQPQPAPIIVTPAPVLLAPPYRPLPAPPPPPLQPPPRITNCNVFRCYDENGGVHPR